MTYTVPLSASREGTSSGEGTPSEGGTGEVNVLTLCGEEAEILGRYKLRQRHVGLRGHLHTDDDHLRTARRNAHRADLPTVEQLAACLRETRVTGQPI